MSLDFTDDQSTLVQVMAWCRQATSHYLSQCWPGSVSPYDITRPQWVFHAVYYQNRSVWCGQLDAKYSGKLNITPISTWIEFIETNWHKAINFHWIYALSTSRPEQNGQYSTHLFITCSLKGSQLVISQHWFRWWLGACSVPSRHLSQWWPRSNDDQDRGCHDARQIGNDTSMP